MGGLSSTRQEARHRLQTRSPVFSRRFTVTNRSTDALVRKLGIAALWLALGPLAGCQAGPRREAASFSRELASGARYARELASRQQASDTGLPRQEVIAAGYLERLRLGMGSPFRLMEYALHDPRLTSRTRTPLVWALMAGTREGRAYRVDPQALVPVSADARDRDVELGRMHQRLIEHAVRGAGDPRVGEVAVREAYRLAATSHAVSPAAPSLAASAAALARDRELARRDAERLLAHAAEAARHPFAVLMEWRRDRRFEVEEPPAAPRTLTLDEAAAHRAVLLVGQVEAVRERFRGGVRLPPDGDTVPRLSAQTGRRLARAAGPGGSPTQSPVWVTVQRYDDELRRVSAGDARAAGLAARLLEHARTEEALAAEYASFAAAPGPLRQTMAVIALEAGVAMRAYGQERVWFPGFPAPSDADLRRIFGIRGVEFDAGVPLSWRPYYRRMVGDALADLELVLPSLDLRDAGFKIGTTKRTGLALAIHDPYGRTIVLPPESGAGAIAHEVGHDLDWQVAYARYRTRAAYGTEHVARAGPEDDFATAVRRMPVPPEVPMRGGAEVQRRYAQRPPEIFARTFDGYVAVALALRGRSNGYLTTAQDEFIGTSGLALMPGARTDAAGPFMDLMTVASPVPADARRDFMGRWGPGRTPSGFDLARRIAGQTGSAPAPAVRPAPGMAEVVAAGGQVRVDVDGVLALRDGALAEWAAARCSNPLVGWASRPEPLVHAAAEARIRGVVLAHARALGFHGAPAWLREAWLGGAAEREPLRMARPSAASALAEPMERCAPPALTSGGRWRAVSVVP